MLDPDMSKFNFQETSNYLFTDILKVDEEKFKAMIKSEQEAVKSSSATDDQKPVNKHIIDSTGGNADDESFREIIRSALHDELTS